jgi:hypothetical protein
VFDELTAGRLRMTLGGVEWVRVPSRFDKLKAPSVSRGKVEGQAILAFGIKSRSFGLGRRFERLFRVLFLVRHHGQPAV